jgi:hypothetical protein
MLALPLAAQAELTNDLREYTGEHWQLMTQGEKHRFTEGFLLGLWVILKPIEIQAYMDPSASEYLTQAAMPLHWNTRELTEALDAYYRRFPLRTPIWKAIYDISLKELP